MNVELKRNKKLMKQVKETI